MSGFDRIVREAREHHVPDTHGVDHDWRDEDAALFARLAREPARTPAPRRSNAAIVSGVMLAAAAAVTLALRPSAPRPVEGTGRAELAASVRAGEGLTILDANGAPRAIGQGIHTGDRLTTAGTDVGFVSLSEAGTQAVAWRLERESSLIVTRARLPLGLALDRGAVEADVAKVASGEAFVVDVGGVRVAVRGTHLRVARTGDRATVDLTEGTIAIGPIPREGMTEGTMLTAPAHVELDLTKPNAAVIAPLERDNVRAPAFSSEVRVPVATPPIVRSPQGPAHSAAPLAPLPPPVTPPPPTATTAPLTVNEVIAQAVRACVEKHVSTSQVHVTVSTTLVLDVVADGSVRRARFEPPLAPEVQACAAETIYKTRFASAGTERITIVAER